MSEAATPTVPADGQPPVAPVATPANPQPETVTLDKKAHDELVRNAARAGEAQSRADRYETVLKKNGLLGGGHFKPAAPATPPTPEEREAAGAEEDRKAERGLLGVALDPNYREVLDKDPTLRDLLTKNPLAVLPIYASEALDADDAVELVKGMLDRRKSNTPQPTPAVPATPTPPAVPPTGVINANDATVDENYEAARKNTNVEKAVAGMVSAKLKQSAGKK